MQKIQGNLDQEKELYPLHHIQYSRLLRRLYRTTRT